MRYRKQMTAMLVAVASIVGAALISAPPASAVDLSYSFTGECDSNGNNDPDDDTVTVTVTNTGDADLIGLIIVTTYVGGPGFPTLAGNLAPGESVQLGPIDVVGAVGEIGVNFGASFQVSAVPDKGIGPFLPGCASVPVPVVKCKGKVATIVGTNKAETLRGTNKRDVIVAKGGGDTIIGRGGNDLICAGGGNDDVKGGGGRDTVYAGAGKDTVDGQGGNDRLFGEKGRDTLLGRSGADLLDGGPQRDICNGHGGKDRGPRCEVRPNIP